MDKPMTFNEWMGKQGNLALVHANCCRIAYEAGQQSQQAKVEELQKRVDFLEKHLKPCECGSKEISVDQEGYITKHCYRCGGIRTQEMIEQALKGEG